jgi:hypothetical protein
MDLVSAQVGAIGSSVRGQQLAYIKLSKNVRKVSAPKMSMQTRYMFPVGFCFGRRALQRHCTKKSKQIFPEMKLCGLVPNFHIHVSLSDLYIPTIDLPILLRKYGTIVGIYIAWKLGT